jgi:hypothetical protein
VCAVALLLLLALLLEPGFEHRDVEDIGVEAAPLGAIEGVDGRHVGCAEGEVEDVDIGGDAVGMDALGDDREAVLDNLINRPS